MEAKLIKTDGPGREAVLEIGGSEYRVMDSFSWLGDRCPRAGESFHVKLGTSLDESWSWEKIFAANPDERMGLEPLGGWSYLAFGRIESLNPVIVDCGLLIEGRALFTHDPRVIGEFIGFRIEVLDATG
jgi:hypothetical protein